MKPIAGMGDLPYNIGGFCVTAANINGELKYNLNILQQRSSNVFDLIDTDFNVYTFVSLTSYDKNKIKLDPSKSATELAALLPKNTFVITVDSSDTITAFQSNKIKLNSGLMKYRPWDLYFCNIPDPDGGDGFDPTNSSIMVFDDNAYIDDGLDCVVLYLFRKSGLPYVVDRSALTMRVKSGYAILDSVDFDMASMGQYKLYYKSSISGTSNIEVIINSTNSLSTDIHFKEYGTVPDPAKCTMQCYGENLYSDGETVGYIYLTLYDENMDAINNYDISKLNFFVISTTGDATKVVFGPVVKDSSGFGVLYEVVVTTTVAGDYVFGCTIDGVTPRVLTNTLTYSEPFVYDVSLPSIDGVTYGINSSFPATFTPNTIWGAGNWTTTTPDVDLSYGGSVSSGKNYVSVESHMIGDIDLTFKSSTPYKVTKTMTFVSEPQKNIVAVEGIGADMLIKPNMTFKIRVNLVPNSVTKPTGLISTNSSHFSDRVEIINYDGLFTYTMRSRGPSYFPDVAETGAAEFAYANYQLSGLFYYKISDKNGNF